MRMKLVLCCAILAGFLSGCSVGPDYETIADVWEETRSAVNPGRLELPLPEGAEMEVMESSGDSFYSVGSWDLWTKVLSGGDMERTLETISSVNAENMTTVKRNMGAVSCTETVWSVASEEGQRDVRAGVLDDGGYHYCICLSAPEEDAEEAAQVFRELLSSARIIHTEP